MKTMEKATKMFGAFTYNPAAVQKRYPTLAEICEQISICQDANDRKKLFEQLEKEIGSTDLPDTKEEPEPEPAVLEKRGYLISVQRNFFRLEELAQIQKTGLTKMREIVNELGLTRYNLYYYLPEFEAKMLEKGKKELNDFKTKRK